MAFSDVPWGLPWAPFFAPQPFWLNLCFGLSFRREEPFPLAGIKPTCTMSSSEGDKVKIVSMGKQSDWDNLDLDKSGLDSYVGKSATVGDIEGIAIGLDIAGEDDLIYFPKSCLSKK